MSVGVMNVHLWNGPLCVLQAGSDEKDTLIEGTDDVHADLIILMYTDGLTNQMQTLFHPKKDIHISSISSQQKVFERNIHTTSTINTMKCVLAVHHNTNIKHSSTLYKSNLKRESVSLVRWVYLHEWCMITTKPRLSLRKPLESDYRGSSALTALLRQIMTLCRLQYNKAWLNPVLDV